MDKLIVVPDVHCRSFFLNVLFEKKRRVIFTGDYMDPYRYEGFTDEEGIEKLEEIIDYKKSRPNEVTLLIGNHDTSWIWSPQGFERTSSKHYNRLHKLYRDNINLFEPCKLIGDTLFTHAGVSKRWLESENKSFLRSKLDFNLNELNIVQYINSEYFLELERDRAIETSICYPTLKSSIFNIGWARGGYGIGGPFWSDFNQEFSNPNWNLWQVFGHQQATYTGSIRTYGNAYCLDSRAVFEYDLNAHTTELSELTENYEKIKEELDKLYNLYGKS